MKTIYIVIISLVIFGVSGCEQQGIKPCLKASADSIIVSPKLQQFSGIDLNADIDLFVSQDKDQKVSIVGAKNLVDELKIEVSGGALTISSNRCFAASSAKPKVYVTIPQISRLEVSGTGNIYSKGKLLCNVVEFKLLGAGNLDIETDADRIITTLAGSGNINLKGSANSHFVKFPGSGKVASYGMETNDTDINLSGWGQVEVFTQKNLMVNISGDGKVQYKGFPIVKSEISGNGMVVEAN